MTKNATTDNGNATTADTLDQLLLDRDDVAKLLRVPVESVLNLHRAKALSACKIAGRLVRRPQDVRAFVEGLEPES